MAGIPHRLSQFWHYLGFGSQQTVSPALELLSTEALVTFRQLGRGDQRHAIAVATALDHTGASESLVVAGLLHDIGKACPGVRIRLTDRVIKVALERFAPGRLGTLSNQDVMPPRGKGLWVLSRHARVGSEMVGDWGYSARVSWLIFHHEDQNSEDEELQRLIAADAGKLNPQGWSVLSNG